MNTNEHAKAFTGKVLIAAVLAFVLVVTLPEPSSANQDSTVALRPGSWSLQFGIERNLKLGDFDGLLISCKRHYSQKSALRFGVTLSASVRDEDGDYLSVSAFSYDLDATFLRMDIAVSYIVYPRPRDKLNLFLGLGPEIGLQTTKSDETRFRTGITGDHVKQMDERTSKEFYIGARAILGVEWFAMPDVSLTAEYRMSLLCSYEEEDREYGNEPDAIHEQHIVRRGFALESNSVLFGLSVYF